MRIVQVNTFDVHGGAARANFRLHRGLRALGADNAMLAKEKGSDDGRVFQVNVDPGQEGWNQGLDAYRTIQEGYLNRNRTPVSNTVFSHPYHPGYDLSRLETVRGADVINLHWVAEFLSPPVINSLLSLGIPVVWTLHDMWPFTGGCHYSAGCREYVRECARCHLLADDPHHLPKTLLADKLAAPTDNLTIVTPSSWLADRARESRVFGRARVEVIPNGLETDVFAPLPKDDAKRALGIPEHTLALGFGTGNLDEIRKGFKELRKTLELCQRDARFASLMAGDALRLICFGNDRDEIRTLGVPALSLGRIDSDQRLATAYSAMDLFILPSLEDNLPNTMLEAMSCGTPVAGFATGGVPDAVRPEHNGLLAPTGDVESLARAVLDLIFIPGLMRAAGENARGTVLDNHTLQIQAGRYLELYRDLHREQAETPSPGRKPWPGNDFQAPASLETLPGMAAVNANILAHARMILNKQ